MANALLGPDGNQLLIIISSIISSIALIGASALLLFSPPLPPGLSDVERTFVDQYTGKKKKFPHLLPKGIKTRYLVYCTLYCTGLYLNELYNYACYSIHQNNKIFY